MIRYAIFDMDGLMFDSEYLYRKAFVEAYLPGRNIEYTEEKYNQLLGKNTAATRELFPVLFGEEQDYDEYKDITIGWVHDYVAEHGMPVKKGLPELLSWLRARGVTTAMATSTDREVALFDLEHSGLPEDSFDFVICGDMVEHGKPDPEIFRKAAEGLGCTDPSQAVVFEDSLAGMQAGEAGGFPVIVVPDLVDPTEGYEGRCLAKLESLDRAIDVLEGLVPRGRDA